MQFVINRQFPQQSPGLDVYATARDLSVSLENNGQLFILAIWVKHTKRLGTIPGGLDYTQRVKRYLSDLVALHCGYFVCPIITAYHLNALCVGKVKLGSFSKTHDMLVSLTGWSHRQIDQIISSSES
jgi:hypothetical protein